MWRDGDRIAILCASAGSSVMMTRSPATIPDRFLTTFRRMPTANAEGLDRVGGWRSKGLGQTRLWVRSDRHGSSAFAVSMLRSVNKKKAPAKIPEPSSDSGARVMMHAMPALSAAPPVLHLSTMCVPLTGACATTVPRRIEPDEASM